MNRKLIFASIASRVICETGYVSPKPFLEMTLGVVPTAANGEPGDKAWLAEELDVFKNLGFALREINLEDKSEAELRKACEGIDALLVTGGNVYYLLYHVKKSGFDKIITDLVNQGIVYIGSGAGAVITGQSIDVARRFDDPSVVPLTDYTGLGLVDFVIIPHADVKEKTGKLQKTLEEWRGKPCQLIGLTDSQALVCADNFMEILDTA